ncbi:MAG: hypothetical protein ACE5I7_00375 [Candidatus Binatia bacterium]
MRALKHALARLPSCEESPGAVRAHVEALRFGQRPRRPPRTVALGAAAAALLGLAIVTVVVHRSERAARLADDLVADHLHSVPDVRPAEIASSDRAEVARFFAHHVPFPAVVPAMPGATLLGGRLCRIESRRVELLFYRREGRTLSLFVTDRPVASDQCWTARAHHVCSWSNARVTMLLVGKLPQDELRRLLHESA